ncbi:MAG: hypothetical protein ACLQSR_04375, partial [Limisphaerales bacterium]
AQTFGLSFWKFSNFSAGSAGLDAPALRQAGKPDATFFGHAPDVHVVGLSSDFDISMIMKGDKSLKKLVAGAVGAVSSAVAVHLASWRWLYLDRWPRYILFMQRDMPSRGASGVHYLLQISFINWSAEERLHAGGWAWRTG